MKEGKFLFAFNGYDGNPLEPHLVLYSSGSNGFSIAPVRGKTFTLTFDTTTRYCTGWHDLVTSQDHPCPDRAILADKKHWHCLHCRNKTGFNPAFYHSKSISQQQEARNQSPHTLYLVHFAPNVIKVGIMWSERGIRRLLNQGSRTGLVLKAYPTANIARQYEAKIAKMDGLHETLQVKTKMKLLNGGYDSEQALADLRRVKEHIADELGITPDTHEPEYLDPYHLGNNTLAEELVDVGKAASVSGRCLGMIGSVIIMEQDGAQFGLSLHELFGYPVAIQLVEQPNQYQPLQARLF